MGRFSRPRSRSAGNAYVGYSARTSWTITPAIPLSTIAMVVKKISQNLATTREALSLCFHGRLVGQSSPDRSPRYFSKESRDEEMIPVTRDTCEWSHLPERTFTSSASPLLRLIWRGATALRNVECQGPWLYGLIINSVLLSVCWHAGCPQYSKCRKCRISLFSSVCGERSFFS